MNEADFFRAQAEECRAAARDKPGAGDGRALRQLARYYEAQAAKVAAPRRDH